MLSAGMRYIASASDQARELLGALLWKELREEDVDSHVPGHFSTETLTLVMGGTRSVNFNRAE
jgi:hypothetical protein